MIDGILFLVFLWAMMYFVSKSMYNDILSEKIIGNNRKMLIELAGIFCFISLPIGFVYVCFEFVILTLKMICENVKLTFEIFKELNKLTRG